MPDWLATPLIVVSSITAFAAFLGVVRNKIVRPLMKGYAQLLALLGQIRDASTGVQKLAREVEALAGAISNFVVGMKDEIDRNSERLDRLEDMRELVVDLEAAVARHIRDPGGHA